MGTLLRGVVLGKVLVAVGVHDGLSRVAPGQFQAIRLAGSVVEGTTVDVPAGSEVDERSGLGIGTGVGGTPVAIADPDLSGLIDN